jgi:cation diffusion facilitator CzcD-associated flavoprotein CzcO
MVFVEIKPSTTKAKKLMAIFYDEKKKKIKTVHFGQKGFSDFPSHKDKSRKERYLTRHEKRENWNDYMTAGSLSRWILWNKPTLKASISDYKKRFNLKTYKP